jgi:hypothetical protein
MGTNKNRRKVKVMEYTYCFIRKDIPLHAQIIQTAHACLQSDKPKSINSIVLFEVKNEEHLVKTNEYLKSHGLKTYMFYEPDYDMGYTSIATEPLSGEDREVCKRFKMWS